MPDQKAQVQMVAMKMNIDWTKVWAVIQRLSPIVQEVIITILEETSNHTPQLAAAVGPTQMFTMESVTSIARDCNCDPTELFAFLQSLPPIVQNLMVALLKKKALQHAQVHHDRAADSSLC